MSRTTRAAAVMTADDALDLALTPPGERYFRHPGDVLKVLVAGGVAIVIALFIAVADASSTGVTTDLGRAAARIPLAGRELLLALTQVVCIAVPAVIVVVLVVQQRWRRVLLLALGAAAGAGVMLVLDALLDLPTAVADAVSTGTWVASTRFPSLAYVGAVTAAATVGKPWLPRQWRRASDVALFALIAAMAIAGSAGVPDLLLAVSAGVAAGAGVLVAFGAPNRRPSPAAVAEALRSAGTAVADLTLDRAEGGRAQLYRGEVTDGGKIFVKVYAEDSRDADLLYRVYRAVAFRGANDDWPSMSLRREVEHESLLLLLARRAGVACPRVEALTSMPDGSVALALEYVGIRSLDSLSSEEFDANLLDATWREVARLHDARIAHRSLRAANIRVEDHRPVIIDMSFAEESATDRMQAIDRAELLASLAVLVGAERVVASATRVLAASDLAAAMPYLQPLALSAATRKQCSKGLLRELRSSIATETGVDAPPLERLVRVRPRTLLMIAVLTGAFYILLPQLADVGDSFQALRSANFWWLGVCVLMSLLTYVGAAIGLAGGVAGPLPFVPTVGESLASSFVNRVTPANVGGMALSVRYLQKAGVEPGPAVTAMGLNVVAGAIVHLVLLFVFFAWAGQASSGFTIPSSSKLLVIIAVVLAVAGIVVATRRGRHLVRKYVLRSIKESWASLRALSKSPLKLTMLFGGSVGVTLAYIAAFAAALAAFGSNVSFAQCGAVYLGASLVAAAAPTPGGLGAVEAALVAGLTGVGVESGEAVAAVLSYRLATYWLPVLPGWLAFHALERRNYI